MTVTNMLQNQNEALTLDAKTLSIADRLTNQKGFDQFFAERSQQDEKIADKQSTSRKSQAKNTAVNNKEKVGTRRTDERASDETAKDTAVYSTKKKDSTGSTDSTDKTSGTSSDDQLKDDIDTAEEEIVSTVADILQVPVETLMQWLAELNLTPLDLVDPQAVTQLLQKAFGVSTPSMLLNVPDFQNAFQAINEAMVEYQALAETAKNATDLSNLQGLQVVVDENNEMVVVDASETETAQEQSPTQLSADTLPNESETADETTAQPTQTVQQTATSNEGNAGSGNASQQQNGAADQDLDDLSAYMPNASFDNAATRTTETSTPASASARSNTGSAVNATDMMNQIMSRVRMHSGDQFAELKITLRPESLGDVTLRVVAQNGIVTAQFVAENQRVKEVLEANFNQLKDVLQQQGVQISELSVSVRQDDNGERMNQFLRAQQSGRRRMQRITNRTAEVEAETVEAPLADPSEVLLNSVDFTA